MRLHIWDESEDNVPPVIAFTNDGVQILDYPHWEAYEVGDQIQHLTAIGTNVYFVVDVQPETEIGGEGSEMRRVTIEPA